MVGLIMASFTASGASLSGRLAKAMRQALYVSVQRQPGNVAANRKVSPFIVRYVGRVCAFFG